MSERGDTIPAYMRVLAAIVVLALVAGWVVLLVVPSHTDSLFVWPIRPRLSGFMLGSAYAAGTYYWLRVLIGRTWHEIAAGLLPVTLFATTLGLATAIHWPLFDHSGVGIVVWVVLYITVPLALPAIWLAERRRDSRTCEPADAVVPPRARVVLAGLGAAQLALGLALFVAPGVFHDRWPWHLSDLTAQVTAGWFAWGLVWIMLLRDPRWSSARVAVDATLIGVLVALTGIARSFGELDRARVSTWLLSGGLTAGFAALAVFRVAMRRAPREHRAPTTADDTRFAADASRS